jgi:hypothetical protein
MSKIDDVRIKQYPRYISPGEWQKGLGWRIERFVDGVWKLIAYRGDRSEADRVAQQAADVLSSSYVGEQ